VTPEGNIVVAIILLTVLMRVLVIPLYRRQLTSTRQMQLIQPEVKELQLKPKKADTTVTRLALVWLPTD